MRQPASGSVLGGIVRDDEVVGYRGAIDAELLF